MKILRIKDEAELNKYFEFGYYLSYIVWFFDYSFFFATHSSRHILLFITGLIATIANFLFVAYVGLNALNLEKRLPHKKKLFCWAFCLAGVKLAVMSVIASIVSSDKVFLPMIIGIVLVDMAYFELSGILGLYLKFKHYIIQIIPVVLGYVFSVLLGGVVGGGVSSMQAMQHAMTLGFLMGACFAAYITAAIITGVPKRKQKKVEQEREKFEEQRALYEKFTKNVKHKAPKTKASRQKAAANKKAKSKKNH